jgi:diaminohydroxyphosphoribosylaminopyrimidine deaminase/5-amino-6-(5-phosphoribosylamino)uracil reductase
MDDEHWMRRAIAAAARVAGRTGDNPAVGCVIVRDGEAMAEGATQPPPGPHAEAVAIRAAESNGIDLRACDLYVTLEPCAFHGRTPPCSRLIVEKRPRRVLVALRDPHPRVNGAGLREIRGAGIEVVEGVLAEEAARGLADWLSRFGRSVAGEA